MGIQLFVCVFCRSSGERPFWVTNRVNSNIQLAPVGLSKIDDPRQSSEGKNAVVFNLHDTNHYQSILKRVEQ